MVTKFVMHSLSIVFLLKTNLAFMFMFFQKSLCSSSIWMILLFGKSFNLFALVTLFKLLI